LSCPTWKTDINIYPNDCLLRVCYAELAHELGKDGKTRLSVERYIVRQEALELNPTLARVKVPSNAPASKKLQKTNNSSAAATTTTADPDLKVEPDDIPF
jgi:hypothetical protein